METTFTEAKGLAKVFKLVTLATLIAVTLNIFTTVPRLFGAGLPRGAHVNFFNLFLGFGIELARLAGSFWIFSQFARGIYASEGLVKGCRLLSFLEFLRCFQYLQTIMLMPRGMGQGWYLYSQIFQGVTVTLVTAALLYCLGTAIHWSLVQQREAEEKRLLEKLNALPPLEGPPGESNKI